MRYFNYNCKVSYLMNKIEGTEQTTSIELMVEFSRVGSALLPTNASPSIDKCSNRSSIFGISIPTLFITKGSHIDYLEHEQSKIYY